MRFHRTAGPATKSLWRIETAMAPDWTGWDPSTRYRTTTGRATSVTWCVTVACTSCSAAPGNCTVLPLSGAFTERVWEWPGSRHATAVEHRIHCSHQDVPCNAHLFPTHALGWTGTRAVIQGEPTQRTVIFSEINYIYIYFFALNTIILSVTYNVIITMAPSMLDGNTRDQFLVCVHGR